VTEVVIYSQMSKRAREMRVKCLRCGYCCHNACVVIVDDPKKGPIEDNLKIHTGEGKSCQHLRGNKPGGYSCAVHDEPWYADTPCAHHGQIENRPDMPCRMGVYVLKKHRVKPQLMEMESD